MFSAIKKLWKTPKGYLFSNADLVKLVIPILIETAMLHLVGSCDTIMVASLGEVSTSGVSITSQLNTFFSTMYMALGVGGSIAAAQALGANKREAACRIARQQIQIGFLIGLFFTILIECFGSQILKLIYPRISNEVMQSGISYLSTFAIAYPLSAVRWSIAGLFRIMKKPNYSMMCAIFANIINVCLNALFIYKFQWGVAGAALASICSLSFSFSLMLYWIANPRHPITFNLFGKIYFDKQTIRKVLYFGVPHGIEQALFQLGRVLTYGVIVAYGKEQIAANSMVITMATICLTFAAACCNVATTVIGQTTGVGDEKQSRYYVKKIFLFTYMGHFINSFLTLCCTPLFFWAFRNFSQETLWMAKVLFCFYLPSTLILWPLSFAFPAILKAMNDVKYVMWVAIGSMALFRVAICYPLANFLHHGLYAVFIAMYIDWIVRIICFIWRYRSNRWLKYYNLKSLKA